MGTSRAGSEGTSSHDGVLTSLLNEMDGIQELAGVTVVAATNRPDVLVRVLSPVRRPYCLTPPSRRTRH